MESICGVLGFINIGQMAGDNMTADVRSEYAAASGGKSEKRAAATARVEEMMSWWREYNHYNANFSNYILADITSAAAELIKKIM